MKQCAAYSICLVHSVSPESQMSSTFTVHHTYLSGSCLVITVEQEASRLKRVCKCVCTSGVRTSAHPGQLFPFSQFLERECTPPPHSELHLDQVDHDDQKMGWGHDTFSLQNLVSIQNVFYSYHGFKSGLLRVDKTKEKCLKGSYYKKNCHRFDNVAFG